MSEEVQQQLDENQSASVPDAQNQSVPETDAVDTSVEDGGAEVKDAQEAEQAIKRGKNYYARKIDEATKRAADAERRADMALQALASGRNPPQQQAPKTEEKPPAREQFNTWEDWNQATAVHAAQKAAREHMEQFQNNMSRAMQMREQHMQTQALEREFTAKRDAEAKSIPDWDSVIEDAADMPVTPAMDFAIKNADHPAKVIHYLAKNPSVAAKLAGMPPQQVLVAIGRIEGSLSVPASVSKAPPPGKPVGARGGGMRDLEEMSMDDFIKARNKQK